MLSVNKGGRNGGYIRENKFSLLEEKKEIIYYLKNSILSVRQPF